MAFLVYIDCAFPIFSYSRVPRGGFEYVAILIRSMKDLLINIQILPTLLGAIVINFYIF